MIDTITVAGRTTPTARKPVDNVLGAIDAVLLTGVFIGAVGIVALVVNIGADVIMRNMFNAPVQGTLEMVTYFWMPLLSLGFGYVQAHNEQIRVTMLVERNSAPVARWTALAGEVVVGLLSLMIAWIALGAAQEMIGKGATVPGRDWILIWPSHYVVFASYVLFALGAVYRFIAVWTRRDVPFEDEAAIADSAGGDAL